MRSLELKIPPLLLLLVFIGLGWVLRNPAYPQLGFTPENIVALIAVTLGVLVIGFGVLGFHRQQTTVDPRFPEQTSTLVVIGIYKYSRNPMYLGFSLILIAWSLLLFSIYTAILVPIFIVYITQWQIKPEERLLEGKFKQDYVDYKASVRRWI